MHSDPHAMTALDLDGLRSEMLAALEVAANTRGFGDDMDVWCRLATAVQAGAARISTLEREVMQGRGLAFEEAAVIAVEYNVGHEHRVMTTAARVIRRNIAAAIRARAALNNTSSEGAF